CLSFNRPAMAAICSSWNPTKASNDRTPSPLPETISTTFWAATCAMSEQASSSCMGVLRHVGIDHECNGIRLAFRQSEHAKTFFETRLVAFKILNRRWKTAVRAVIHSLMPADYDAVALKKKS